MYQFNEQFTKSTAQFADVAANANRLALENVQNAFGLQLAALATEPRAGRDAGEGLRTAWQFASPGNRAATGPLERFALMLRSPAYLGLLEHRAAQLGPVVLRGDEARLEVLVLTADDQAQGYTWVLGRQSTAPWTGCWMTDGVLLHPDDRGRG